MLNEMTINAEQVRSLRDSRGWSQEHLAEVAGLSLRTIQRVESEGRGSRETRLSLAAAFDVPLGRLAASGPNDSAFGRGDSGWVSLIAVGTVIVLTGLVTGLNKALLVTGAAIQVGGLCTYGLEAINVMRRAAGLRPMLSSSGAVSAVSLIVIGSVVLVLGYLLTDVVWFPGYLIAGVGAVGLIWHGLRNRIVGRANNLQSPGGESE